MVYRDGGAARVDEAKKFDDEKVRLELIPPEMINALGEILTFGAAKYEDRNWEKGMDWGRIYGALQRHLNAWWGGELLDPETNKSHLWHAACCIAFLVTYEERKVGTDTRPTKKSDDKWKKNYVVTGVDINWPPMPDPRADSAQLVKNCP